MQKENTQCVLYSDPGSWPVRSLRVLYAFFFLIRNLRAFYLPTARVFYSDPPIRHHVFLPRFCRVFNAVFSFLGELYMCTRRVVYLELPCCIAVWAFLVALPMGLPPTRRRSTRREITSRRTLRARITVLPSRAPTSRAALTVRSRGYSRRHPDIQIDPQIVAASSHDDTPQTQHTVIDIDTDIDTLTTPLMTTPPGEQRSTTRGSKTNDEGARVVSLVLLADRV